METACKIQGRSLSQDDIEFVRRLILDNPTFSRRRISEQLAKAWDWRAASGQLKDMAARSLLLKLEARGLIVLPKRRREPSRRLSKEAAALEITPPPSIAQPLADLMPIDIAVVKSGHPDYNLFCGYLMRYHYLGFGGPVGENLGYLARDRSGRDIACLLFGAPAWRLAPRDAFIGWDDAMRQKNLCLIANNTRFLILPWVNAPNLASHILSRMAKRLCVDWLDKYNHPIHAIETFVDRERFTGACYRAANWTCVGATKGRSRQDRNHKLKLSVKDIYIYTLGRHAKEGLLSC